jgi:hypothetical protein
LLVLAHKGLKFWKWLMEDYAKMVPELDITELKEGFDKWFNAEDRDVRHYFKYVLDKDDDRFHDLERHNDAPEQQSSADPAPETSNAEELKADNKAGQEKLIFLPDGSVFNPNKDENAPNDWRSAGRNKPRGHAAQGSKGQANASSTKPGSKDTKGKAVQKSWSSSNAYQHLDPDDECLDMRTTFPLFRALERQRRRRRLVNF